MSTNAKTLFHFSGNLFRPKHFFILFYPSLTFFVDIRIKNPVISMLSGIPKSHFHVNEISTNLVNGAAKIRMGCPRPWSAAKNHSSLTPLR